MQHGMEQRLETQGTIREVPGQALCVLLKIKPALGEVGVWNSAAKTGCARGQRRLPPLGDPNSAPCRLHKGLSPSAGDENKAQPAVFSIETCVSRCSFPAENVLRKRSRRKVQRMGVGGLQI